MNIQIIPVTPFQQNCSVVWDNDRNAAIIDPGGDVEKIIAFIRQQQLKPQLILLTHGHLDHVGGAAKLKRAFDLEIVGPHRADDYWLQALPQQAERFAFPYCAALTPDRWLNEGDSVRFGAVTFSVLHLPGHTPGHIGFIERNERIAFTGDVLFHRSIGRTDFPGGDFAQLIKSIQEKLWALDDDTQIIAGHGLLTTIGDEKRHNPFLQAQNID